MSPLRRLSRAFVSSGCRAEVMAVTRRPTFICDNLRMGKMKQAKACKADASPVLRAAALGTEIGQLVLRLVVRCREGCARGTRLLTPICRIGSWRRVNFLSLLIVN